jgi:hypothetical protein
VKISFIIIFFNYITLPYFTLPYWVLQTITNRYVTAPLQKLPFFAQFPQKHNDNKPLCYKPTKFPKDFSLKIIGKYEENKWKIIFPNLGKSTQFHKNVT